MRNQSLGVRVTYSEKGNEEGGGQDATLPGNLGLAMSLSNAISHV